jgi:hypothetical protein
MLCALSVGAAARQRLSDHSDPRRPIFRVRAARQHSFKDLVCGLRPGEWFWVVVTLDDFDPYGQPARAALIDAASPIPATSTWSELTRAQALLQRTDQQIR